MARPFRPGRGMLTGYRKELGSLRDRRFAGLLPAGTERDLIVQIAAAEPRPGAAAGPRHLRLTRCGGTFAAGRSLPRLLAVQENQGAVVGLDLDLGRVTISALVVRPLVRCKLTLDQDLRAFGKIALRDFREALVVMLNCKRRARPAFWFRISSFGRCNQRSPLATLRRRSRAQCRPDPVPGRPANEVP
ncbi:MAG: hypothetical protein QOD93_2792 [Acetobacteraceae bacterium]|nr:hypothetical protein [Acetobacteraceae bacterium]